MKQILGGLFVVLLTASCQSSKQNMKTENPPVVVGQPIVVKQQIIGGPVNVSSPVVFIYKTNGDYYYNVPVMMNNDRTAIVSYPAPVDLTYGGKLRLPTHLVDGYLLDNRGIGPNVAFLSYTYEEYSQMKQAPSMDELMNHIISKYPLTVWHQCGRWADYTDIVPQLNALIEKEYMK